MVCSAFSYLRRALRSTVLDGVFSHLPEILLDNIAGNVFHFLKVDR